MLYTCNLYNVAHQLYLNKKITHTHNQAKIQPWANLFLSPEPSHGISECSILKGTFKAEGILSSMLLHVLTIHWEKKETWVRKWILKNQLVYFYLFGVFISPH